jgi:hypothetical protein
MTNQNARLLTFALSRLPKNLFGGQAFCTFIFAFCILKGFVWSLEFGIWPRRLPRTFQVLTMTEAKGSE